MKGELFIVFLIVALYFKTSNILNRLSFVKGLLTGNYIVTVLILLIIIVGLSSYIGKFFKNKNLVSGDDLMEEFNFVNDVRNVTRTILLPQ